MILVMSQYDILGFIWFLIFITSLLSVDTFILKSEIEVGEKN